LSFAAGRGGRKTGWPVEKVEVCEAVRSERAGASA
jgi:hypothetical protein